MGEAFNPQAIIQTKTVSTTVSGLSSADVSVAWDREFPNDQYEVSVVQFDETNTDLQDLQIRGCRTRTASTAGIRVSNTTAGSITTELLAIGVWTP